MFALAGTGLLAADSAKADPVSGLGILAPGVVRCARRRSAARLGGPLEPGAAPGLTRQRNVSANFLDERGEDGY